MSRRIIPITERRGPLPRPPDSTELPALPVSDRFSRPLRDLRVSVTDRCNFRCTYCMPREVFGKDYPFLPHSALLTFEEIARVAAAATRLGVHKIRLTGGEPLLRKNLSTLVSLLSALRTPEGEALDLAMTTNGSVLARFAEPLRQAGLARLTVSLDAIDEPVFQRMNGCDFPASAVLEGIEAARQAGFESIKINAVIKRGVNDDQILKLARHFRGSGHVLRFIEYMDVGESNHWRLDEVVAGAEMIERIAALWPLEPVPPTYPGEVANRWRYADGGGEIGVITSVTQPFCGGCTRLRLSNEGRLYTCLFASQGEDVRSLLRDGYSDDAIAAHLARLWQARSDRYSEERADHGTAGRAKIEMSYIGG